MVAVAAAFLSSLASPVLAADAAPTSLPATSVATASSPVDATKAFAEGAGLALQGDLRNALPRLDAALAGALPAKRRAVAACIVARFRAPAPVPAPAELDRWTAGVLDAYRDYWTDAMLGAVAPQGAERTLAQRLAAALGRTPGEGMDTLEPLVDARIEAAGLHALFGRTAPLREFMLWRKQSAQAYDVTLPSGPQQVIVEWLDDIVSLGWSGYATCDYQHTGGWATLDRLYAVRSAYDLDSESFRVSYLQHEGQHFADYRRFPGMAQPDLEYRAKLVELAYAKDTIGDLIEAFSDNASTSREQPHAWANREVVARLGAALFPGKVPTVADWRAAPPPAVNSVARRLFDEDTARRGAGTK